MAPIPDESKDNPADNDPDHAESEDLETPNHIIPPGPETSSDEDGYDSDEDGPVSQGYMLLSQDPEEELGAGDSLHPQPSPCLLYTSPSPRDRHRSRMPSSA